MSQSSNQYRRLSLLATAFVVALVMITGCAKGPPATEALPGDQGAEFVVPPTSTPDPGFVKCDPDYVIFFSTIKDQTKLVPCELDSTVTNDCVGFTNYTGTQLTVTGVKDLFGEETVEIPAYGTASRVIIAAPPSPNEVLVFEYEVPGATCYEPSSTPRIIVKASTQ